MSDAERHEQENAERAERQAERRREAERRAERRRRIEALLAEGLGQREVARRVGCSPSIVNAVANTDRPARPVNFPPAEPGNTRAMTHGLSSPRVEGAVIEPRARELAPQIIDAYAHLDAVRDGVAVRRLAMVYARLEHAYAWLAEQDDELFANRAEGAVHGLYGRIAKWEAQAGREEERLGISPRERTRLKLDQASYVRALSAGAGRIDLSRLDDDELALYRQLAEKAAIDGEATEAA